MTLVTALRDQLQHAADPADARRWLDRLIAAGLDAPALATGGEALLEVTRIACAQAPYLAILATRDVGRLAAAASDPYLRREKPREVMAAELDGAIRGAANGRELSARLRAYRAREVIRLGVRECGYGDPEEVGRELSRLADLALDSAVRFHDAELERELGTPGCDAERPGAPGRRAGFVVFGMGKLGGEELNFSSDIDLIYFYTSDSGSAGRHSLHEYFDKLARRVTRTIGEVTEDDVVFRVDLRLRPEGSRGPLVYSLPSAEQYYETFGRAWERQAWLKARPCAGDLALGAEVLAALEPFIYPRHTSPNVIREVEELNRRIKAELDGAGLGSGFDVKTGLGGIREIEFFVQALQLIHAGKNLTLRERSTRRALDRLFYAGLIADRERRALANGYAFLRQVEHLLQLESGRQTHRLPSDVDQLQVVARRLGMSDAGEFAGRLGHFTEAVAAIFATLGGAEEIPREIATVLDRERPEPELRAALESLGFREPETAAFQVELLRRKPLSPLGAAATEFGAHLAPALVKEIAASPDPDQALRIFVDFAGGRAAWSGLWQLLDENRPLLRLLTSLFGTSAFLARVFVEHPELTDALILQERARPTRSREQLERTIEERLRELPTGDDAAVWNALRRLKSEELLRVGMADIASDLDADAVSENLSDLADVCVARTFDYVRSALVRRYGRVAPMSVVGLGKLGGRELGYGSDLDLVFVYDGDVEDHEAMTKLAQRLVNALAAYLEEGRLYEVDTRLRPSGQKGTLVSSLTAWRQYHQAEAKLWERQALIKARAIAGDPALGAVVEAEAARHVYERPVPDARAVADEIAHMRERIEKELARESSGPYDIKTGRGGLLDVEFAAQYVQLVHGPARPELRVRSTVTALDRAAAAGLVDEETRATLVGGYRFLRRLEHRLRIVQDRPIHELPHDAAVLDMLARRTGFPSGSSLERAYLNWTRDVRASYERLLGLPPSGP